MSFFKTDAHPTFDHASEPSQYTSKFSKPPTGLQKLKTETKIAKAGIQTKPVNTLDEWAEF
jgi:hypothetical protein